MTKFKTGDKVTVNIKDRSQWSLYAYTSLQGETGNVTEVKTHHDNGRILVPQEPRYLVEFNPALPPMRSSGSRVTGFWFDEDELVPA